MSYKLVCRWFSARVIKILLSSWDNARESFLEAIILTPLHQLKMELQLSISSYRWLTSCLLLGWWFFGRVIQICEKQLSHRGKAFISLLEDTHLWPKQQLKMEVKFYTSLWQRLISYWFVGRCFSGRDWKIVSVIITQAKVFCYCLKTRFGHKQHFKMEDKLFTSL